MTGPEGVKRTSDHPDEARSRLRAMLGVIEGEMGEARPAHWQDLVALLALGPEPELRSCTQCGRRVMRAARRCGHCWSLLAPA